MINVEVQDKKAILSGSWILSSIQEMKNIEQYLNYDVTSIDFKNVTQMDSVGVATILTFFGQNQIKCIDIPNNIFELFQLYGLNQFKY